ncbi:YdcH family protein [Helicobacter kayseriensis]|uniref:YdcH family protein n=1 Tax=Helicobacter kayseriensis TaxID=2905877 RepID=UPI001E5D5437|nr:YdcH family protein [Helicobacter kayseriensis]MCE3047032.1 YdcH family protein [Helicobacter kayseriensis]MCE3048308.1 YdcH family protein [Helicobacter kayseriensis]
MLHEYREEISQLKQTNAHFAKIFDQHNDLDQKIRNMESGIEIASNATINELKKEKLRLKDEIYQMLQKHQ